jgi:TolB-like protein
MVAVLTILLGAIGAVAEQRVAVLPFAGPDSTAESVSRGFRMAEHVATFMARSGIVKVVERSQVNKVMGEIALGQTGALDESKAARAGKMAGATHLVVGSYEQLGRNIKVQARIVNVESGTVAGSALEESTSESALLDAVSVQLLDALGVKASYNTTYRVKKTLGFVSSGLGAGLAGLAAWSHATYQQADEEYTSSYNLDAEEYQDLRDKAQFHYNARGYFGGGAVLMAGAAVYFFVSNKGEWIFSEKETAFRVVPIMTPTAAGGTLVWRF